jgi:hypothetical protein
MAAYSSENGVGNKTPKKEYLFMMLNISFGILFLSDYILINWLRQN